MYILVILIGPARQSHYRWYDCYSNHSLSLGCHFLALGLHAPMTQWPTIGNANAQSIDAPLVMYVQFIFRAQDGVKPFWCLESNGRTHLHAKIKPLQNINFYCNWLTSRFKSAYGDMILAYTINTHDWCYLTRCYRYRTNIIISTLVCVLLSACSRMH